MCKYLLFIFAINMGEGFFALCFCVCVGGGGGGGLMYLVPTACYVLPMHRVLGPFEAYEEVANNRKYHFVVN